MEDTGNNFQPSKKRTAGVQISKDNPGIDDEETSETEGGTFKRASDDVLATRRIVKVRRQQVPSTLPPPEQPPTPAASNPFAAIRLVPPPPTASDPPVTVDCSVTGKENDNADNKYENEADQPKGGSTAEEKTDNDTKQSESKVDEFNSELSAEKDGIDCVGDQNVDKSVVEKVAGGESSEHGDKLDKPSDDGENEAKKDAESDENQEKDNTEKTTEKTAGTASFGSFKPLSSGQNAFSGFTGTGFSTASFSFGSISKDGSSLGSTTGSLFGLKNEQPSFGFGVSNNGNPSVFGTSDLNLASKSESNKFTTMPEVAIETGEENESTVFVADSVLFEFVAGAWKERGKGELKVNVSTTGIDKARLVMRARGNYRLILNAGLYPDLKLTGMDKKGITFACVNSVSDGKDGLSTIALKFKDASLVEDFRAVVMEHKGRTSLALKTPENSP